MKDGRLMQGRGVLVELLKLLEKLRPDLDLSGSMLSSKTSEGQTSTSTSNSTEERDTRWEGIKPLSGSKFPSIPEDQLCQSTQPLQFGSTEQRIVDPNSGGQKGSKIQRFDLIPSTAMEEVARVYGTGAGKYAERNWEKGYKWGLGIAALERHLNKFKQGRQRDELGNHHLAAVVFHALALITFEMFGLGTDDRSEHGRES